MRIWDTLVERFHNPQTTAGRILAKAAFHGAAGAGIGVGASEASKALNILVVDPDSQTAIVSAFGAVAGAGRVLWEDYFKDLINNVQTVPERIAAKAATAGTLGFATGGGIYWGLHEIFSDSSAGPVKITLVGLGAAGVSAYSTLKEDMKARKSVSQNTLDNQR
jgi:hypothetical protein